MKSQAHQAGCNILGNLGQNHNGNSDLARHLVNIAISAGCDGIVVPQWRLEHCYNIDSPLYRGDNGAQLSTPSAEALMALELSTDTLRDLRGICRDRLQFIGAPFDLEALAEFQTLEVDAYQVLPPVLGHLTLLKAIAASEKPVLLTAGMCTEEDIATAIKTLGPAPVTVLHCVYSEGLQLQDTALWCLPHLKQKFDVPIGYLGLEPGIQGAVAAFAMGATTVEKVFTSDKHLPGPAHATSIDRDELREMVTTLRRLESSLHPFPPRVLLAEEIGNYDNPQASLVAASDLPAGTVLTEPMLSVKLAVNGIGPRAINSVLNRRLAYDVAAGTPLSFGVIDA